MADLAKYGEVRTINSSHADAADHTANRLLSEGWQILTVKVVEAQYRVTAYHEREKNYITKEARVVYVLGKPRK